MEKSSELAAVLQSIYTAISDGDSDALTGCISAREGLVFIGTDPDEWFQDAATIKQMLKAQAGAGVKVRAGSIVAYEEGTVGWVADRGAFVMADGTEVPFRITAVFHRENGGWLLVQEHASIAVSNEEALGVAL
jgi:ketosteroid isomerase-like protein